jgi:hypothetical protein
LWVFPASASELIPFAWSVRCDYETGDSRVSMDWIVHSVGPISSRQQLRFSGPINGILWCRTSRVHVPSGDSTERVHGSAGTCSCQGQLFVAKIDIPMHINRTVHISYIISYMVTAAG